jgi:hypothetical protein
MINIFVLCQIQNNAGRSSYIPVTEGVLAAVAVGQLWYFALFFGVDY